MPFIFPLHNNHRDEALLLHLSKCIFLTTEDLDMIRDLFGSKIAFYFAFLQTYLLYLAFPCMVGLIPWYIGSEYSLLFALFIGIWCTVFLEWWKIRQTDLALRWNIRGIDKLKTNRPQFQHDSETVDASGRILLHFSRRKRILRQLVVIPFVLVCALLLGALVAMIFVVETFIGEVYDGPYKFYLVRRGVSFEVLESNKNRNMYQRSYLDSSSCPE